MKSCCRCYMRSLPPTLSPRHQSREKLHETGQDLRIANGKRNDTHQETPMGSDTADLIDLVQRLGQPRVLVVGDLMLDRYIWGDAERISQEAPVILLHADKREERLGGASSVASMLRALGARVMLAGVVGADDNGHRIRELLLDLGVDDEAVL